ncbi:MAG: TIGR00730 family Rossman fold protein [Acidimicrobiia bacterium]|nr:TIGR00730 family Rossman fold protein [Acidimicrobiia bacterium]NNF64717.1 TIGR00730 family Rossman fold protein [Acidimicrobiia bacterium]
MRPYQLGNPELDARLKALVADAIADRDGQDDQPNDDDIIAEMLVSGLKMLRDDTERGDLKLANSALKEMRYSFLVFSRYRHLPKVTIYGSARTPANDPNYLITAEFARRMSDEYGWMVITGAGPGIMEAGNLGAGEDFSFGVNIRLPFEAEANPYVHESRLINFKYFFTRKLMFVKESDAFCLLPGGFGTQDEAFELLTLIQTGKSDLHPIVMLEAEGTGYWDAWRTFIETLRDQGMISPDDLNLFTITSDVDEACREIITFYGNYHSQRYVDGKLILRVKHEPSDELVAQLGEEFSDIIVDGSLEKTEPSEREIAEDDHVDLYRLRMHFNRRHLGRLRLLVDRLNAAAAANVEV